MTTTFKIRLLLFMLTVSFAITALTVNFTFNKNEVLEFDTKTLISNLHKKEKSVKAFLYSSSFDSLRTIHNNPVYAVDLISTFRDQRLIYIHTYYNNDLTFWGSVRIAPVTDAGMKEGSNLLHTSNGYYEAIKRSSGNFSAVAIIPLKAEYGIKNRHLLNEFSTDLIQDDNLEIASINDKGYDINNIDGKYLLSVKLKSDVTDSFYSTLELWMWLCSVLLGIVFINYLCISLSNKGHVKWAISLFFAVFLGLRILTLEHPWLDHYFRLPVFNPEHFTSGYFFPSLGDFVVNAIMVCWLLCFIYSYRHRIKIIDLPITKTGSGIISFLLGIIIYLIAYQQHIVFSQLVTGSDINFDVTNILYLNSYSWLGILLMCLAIFSLYILIEITLVISQQLPLTIRERFRIFLSGTLIMFLATTAFSGNSIFIIFFAVILFLRGWSFFHKNHNYKLAIFLFTLLLFSIIASIKLSTFRFTKEVKDREQIARTIESADDPEAVRLFRAVEKKILRDGIANNLFDSSQNERRMLRHKIKHDYFDGYLSRYEVAAFLFHNQKNTVANDSSRLDTYKNLVLKGSIKVSDYFYRVSNTFGFQNYFALLPIREQENDLGILVLELKAKTFENPSSFPEVLHDGSMRERSDFNDYSFAFYKNGKLISQKGNFNYDLFNSTPNTANQRFYFAENKGYNHLYYKAGPTKLIVVSRPITTWIMKLASVSFLFLVLITFSLAIVVTHQLWVVFHDDQFRLNNYSWEYLLSRNRILYKTRIQASMVIAIIFTLVIVGGITYYSIGDQFRVQQQEDLLRLTTRINEGLENNESISNTTLFLEESFLNTFADVNATDLNLFDLSGRLIFTTQPKIYETGIIDRRMNSLAFVYMDKYLRSEFLNHEVIGQMKYISAYRPVRNKSNQTIAFLNLPHFSDELEYQEKIGSFLNALINVYALVLLTIALFGVFLANQITHPLTIVAKSLSEVSIGHKHEPIYWKSNDEIGSLIGEYNKMIAALDESAQKLAKSERESAWREMAKQVAHEIKNPLTPLKLGVQLLEKSWKEKDPNFDKKFQRFSKSFIEQIESLSLIASEFSNFAKMPDTPFENVDILLLLEKTITVFDEPDKLSILLNVSPNSNFIVRGGKDHLIRIFNNLIKNASEAIPESRKGLINISVSQKGKHVHIEIKDNGKGIPEDLQESIFHHNFTTKSSGTGLGLAFVKQAVENMYGSIRFETEQNAGTTFFIKLPLANA